MLFESRGTNEIMAKLCRIEHIETIMGIYINNFLLDYVYGYNTKLTNYTINKFDIKEDDIEDSLCTIRDISVSLLMRYQYKLKNNLIHSCEKTILEKINYLKEELKDKEVLDEYLSYLEYNGFRLNRYFSEEVVDKIEEVLIEHIIDVQDVESGRFIKTIRQKEQEIEEEHKIEMKAYEATMRCANEAYQELCELGAFDGD